MKTKHILCGVLFSALATQAFAGAAKMKMTTEVPEGIATPNTLETSIGTLTSVDGVPDAATTQKVYDNLDLNNAIQAFLTGIPIASMYAIEHGLLQTDQRFPGIDDSKEGLKQNADGSYDIYFGPKAPKGQENNWIQTDPGKGWNTILRLYGPLEPFYDKSWMPGDPELVK